MKRWFTNWLRQRRREKIRRRQCNRQIALMLEEISKELAKLSESGGRTDVADQYRTFATKFRALAMK